MTARRIALFWIAAFALIAGSYLVVNRAPAPAPAVGASLAVEDALPAPRVMSTDAQIAFWHAVSIGEPLDHVRIFNGFSSQIDWPGSIGFLSMTIFGSVGAAGALPI